MLQLRQMFASNEAVGVAGITTASSSRVSISSSSTAQQSTPSELNAPKISTLYSDRPQRVVKRIKRVITPDGEEKITIQYIVSDAEVVRVERDLRKKQKELQKIVEGTAAAPSLQRGRPSTETLLSRGARENGRKRSLAESASSNSAAYKEDEGDFDTYEDPGAIVLKLRKISRTVCIICICISVL